MCRREIPITGAAFSGGRSPGLDRRYPRVVARRSSGSVGGSEEPFDMLKLETASDAALMVAIARMHEPALAEAYRRHGGAVLALARRVLGSADLAEEVTQEVFVDLWDSPERFDPGRGALRTFLMTKAHGRAVDIVRSESARRQREERTVRETAVSGYDIEHQAWDLAIAEQVKAAVTSLPVEERTAIEMAYFDGHTYREVASILGQPEGTVKSRIRSGLRRLRSALAQHGVETAWTEP
jgi:RNA polymerase sigma-70 factor (ECF subfamily)